VSHKGPHKKNKIGTSPLTLYANLEESAYNVRRRLNFLRRKKTATPSTIWKEMA